MQDPDCSPGSHHPGNARVTGFAILLALAMLSGCSRSDDTSQASSPPRAVRFVMVENRAIDTVLSATGQLVAREEAAVAPDVSGYRIARVLVDQGEWVKAGQVLVQLDGMLLRSEIAQQKAVVDQATVAFEKARSEAARVAGFEGKGILSEQDLAARRFAEKTAQAQLAQAQAVLSDKQLRDRLMAIRSPVSGQILERNARPGDIAATNMVLFRVVRDGRVELNAEIPERDLTKIHVGESAEVTLANGTVVTGQVRLIGAEINAATRLGQVRISLPVQADIRAGGFATASLRSPSLPVPAIPEAAVRYQAEGASVTLIEARDKVRQVAVKIGRRANGLAELLQGPAVGSRILLRGQSFVLDGDVVKPVPAKAGDIR